MSKTLKYSIFVFLGGCCYGLIIPCVRFAFDMGFTPRDAMLSQYISSAVILAIAVLLFSRKKATLKQIVQLIFMGFISAMVSLCYYNALALISASASVTLLFQFVWMGVLWQAIVERKPPSLPVIVSVITVMIGTVFAVGIVNNGIGNLDPWGVFLGFLSAVFYTALLIATSKFATDLPPINRTLFTSFGCIILALAVNPTFFADGTITQGILWAAVPLGLAGLVIPITLISTGSPHLPAGITTILASGELPCGVLAAVIFLGDPISGFEIFGLVVVLVGIIMSQWPELIRLIKKRRGQLEKA